MKIESILIMLLACCVYISCSSQSNVSENSHEAASRSAIQILTDDDITTGAEQLEAFLPKLLGKNIALAVNQTSMIQDDHLVDVLSSKSLTIKRIFAPEHGFRGQDDAGKHVNDGVDSKTGVEIKSLYGKSKKPTASDLADIDVVIFDIQDVGARFYTYLSTMHYIMEACAENNVKLIILDRPNPHGFYVDGPVLDPSFKSFVGMHSIPIVHGMTFGELAQMIHGEQWASSEGLSMEVVPCLQYNHNATYVLPIKPSPNLPNHQSIMLYPSLCLFEPTNFSIGRGTEAQFQILGSPDEKHGEFYFTPKPTPGAMSPKHNGVQCRGVDLRNYDLNRIYLTKQLDLSFLIENLSREKIGEITNDSFFNKLAGNQILMESLKSGHSINEIRQSWEPALSEFKELRQKYLLY